MKERRAAAQLTRKEVDATRYFFLLLANFPLPLLFLLAAFFAVVVLLFFPRPDPPGNFPPWSCLFTVRQARSSASFFGTPRSS